MSSYQFNQKACVDSRGRARAWVVQGKYVSRHERGSGILSYHDTQAEASEELTRMRGWTNAVKEYGYGFSELKIVNNGGSNER